MSSENRSLLVFEVAGRFRRAAFFDVRTDVAWAGLRQVSEAREQKLSDSDSSQRGGRLGSAPETFRNISEQVVHTTSLYHLDLAEARVSGSLIGSKNGFESLTIHH